MDYNLSDYKAYINVGGSVASFGYKNQEKFEKSGYGFVDVDTVLAILSGNNKRGVIKQFAKSGIPLINFIEIEKLIRDVDINYFDLNRN